MKRLLTVLMLSLGLFSVMPAQAYWHGGWHGGWIVPAVGGALVGAAVYAATAPHYVAAYPPVVVAPPVAPRTAFFCPTSQQYYPNVPACNVPWQQVSY